MKIEDLEQIAGQHNVTLKSLNITSEVMDPVTQQTSTVIDNAKRLQNSSWRSRDEGNAMTVTGDQISGKPLDYTDESMQMLAESMSGVVKQGSPLEAQKQYAYSDELKAKAALQGTLAKVMTEVEAGKTPSDDLMATFSQNVGDYAQKQEAAKLATQQVDQQIKQLYTDAITQHVGPVLDAKNYSTAEKAASIQAISGLVVDADKTYLRDSPEMAGQYAKQMAQTLNQSTFDYPGGSRVHQATYRAFDAVAEKQGGVVSDVEGESQEAILSVKSAKGSQTFNEKVANQHADKAAQDHNVPGRADIGNHEKKTRLEGQVEAGKERMATIQAEKDAAFAASAPKTSVRDMLRGAADRVSSAASSLKATVTEKVDQLKLERLEKQISKRENHLENLKQGLKTLDVPADQAQRNSELEKLQSQYDPLAQSKGDTSQIDIADRIDELKSANKLEGLIAANEAKVEKLKDKKETHETKMQMRADRKENANKQGHSAGMKTA